MKLVLFTKMLKDQDARGLIETAQKHGLDGYDLCVRDGYVVSPQNAATALPALVEALAAEGLCVPMVTGPGDLVRADHPDAERIAAAMRTANVGLLKLGYIHHEPGTDYWQQVGEVRRAFAAWERFGEKHGVKIMYHTHSCHGNCYYLGLNCAGLMHLLREFNPKHLGAYIDAGHMAVDGEPFAFGVSMVREHLAAVALKDVLTTREQHNDEGHKKLRWVPAGAGVVAWSEVFAELRRIAFTGPLSIHCEYEAQGADEFRATMEREIRYFAAKLKSASTAAA